MSEEYRIVSISSSMLTFGFSSIGISQIAKFREPDQM